MPNGSNNMTGRQERPSGSRRSSLNLKSGVFKMKRGRARTRSSQRMPVFETTKKGRPAHAYNRQYAPPRFRPPHAGQCWQHQIPHPQSQQADHQAQECRPRSEAQAHRRPEATTQAGTSRRGTPTAPGTRPLPALQEPCRPWQNPLPRLRREAPTVTLNRTVKVSSPFLQFAAQATDLHHLVVSTANRRDTCQQVQECNRRRRQLLQWQLNGARFRC